MPTANKFVIWITYFSFVTIGMAAGLLNVAWEFIRVTFDVPLDALGILLGFSVIGGITAAFLSGQIIGRVGVVAYLMLGSLVQIIGLIGFAIAPAWGILVFTAIFISGGVGVIDSTMNTFVAERYGTREMNWLHAAFGIGLTIAPLVVTYSAIDFGLGWQAAYIFVAVLQILTFLMLAFTFRHWQIGEVDHETGKETRKSAPILETLRNPMVLLIVLLFFVYVGLEIGTGQLANTLFIEGREIDPRTAGTWVSIYWASFTIGRLLMGFFADRVRDATVMRWAMLLSIVGAAMLWVNITPELGFFGLVLLGFAQAPIFPIVMTQMHERVGARYVANTVGFSIAAVNLSVAVWPGIAAFLAVSLGIEVIGLILTFLAVAMGVIYVIILGLHARKQASNETIQATASMD